MAGTASTWRFTRLQEVINRRLFARLVENSSADHHQCPPYARQPQFCPGTPRCGRHCPAACRLPRRCLTRIPSPPPVPSTSRPHAPLLHLPPPLPPSTSA